MKELRGNEEFFSLSEAADYVHVTRQAIYMAIKHRGLKAVKQKRRWVIARKDLDDYRLNKYNPLNRRSGGVLLQSIEEGYYSVNTLAKIMSEMFGRYYDPQRIYYLLRSGDLAGYRQGSAWVIKREDAIALIEKEQGLYLQVKFA